MRYRTLQSAPLLLPAIALMAGIIVGDWWVEPVYWWVALGCSFVVYWLSRHRPLVQSATIMLLVFILGGVRSSMVRQQSNQLSWPSDVVSYEAVIVSEVSEKPKTVGMDIVITDDGRRLKCYVSKDTESLRLQVGDRLQLRSKIDDDRTFVYSDSWQLLSPSWQGLSKWERIRLHFLCYRHSLLQRYRQLDADDSQYAVIAAMTLGDKSAMTRELKDVYAVSGASHVLALSGLHLGIIYMLLSLLVVGRRFRVVSQALIVLSIWAFVFLVGMSASVVRSALMISVYALLSLANRNRASLNALSLAAILILLFSPNSLYDVGFQLSFSALLAILLIQPLFERPRIVTYLFDRPVLRWLYGLCTVSISAQVGVAPLIAYYFGRFSTYFILTNLLVIPLTTAILYLALTTLVIPVAGVLLVKVVGWLNVSLSFIATSLPCASIEGLHPSVLQTVFVYVFMFSIYLIITIYDKRS